MVLRRAGWGSIESAAGTPPLRAAVLPALRRPENGPVHGPDYGPDDGRSVVLVHGLGCSHRYFRRLAHELARRGIDVAAPDLPGFGLTPASGDADDPYPDVPALAAGLASWLRATGRTGTPLLANSFGAQVLVELAAADPDVPGPLVLVGPALDRGSPSLLAQGLRLIRNGLRESPRVAVLLGRDYLVCGLHRYLATAEAGLRHPTEQRMRTVNAQVTIVRGERDPVSSAAWGRTLAAASGGRYIPIRGAAHLAHWSRPRAVADIVECVLARGS